MSARSSIDWFTRFWRRVVGVAALVGIGAVIFLADGIPSGVLLLVGGVLWVVLFLVVLSGYVRMEAER